MLKVKTSQDKWNKNKIYLNLLKEIKCFKGFKLNISWLNVLWTIFHCSLMTLWWPTPVVCPSWSLASAKPAGHTLSSINIFQTWPLYTDSYQIFHCVWMKGCSSAVLLNIFPLMSTNINVQVSNSYKRNLKVIKCKWTLHSFVLVCIA